MQANSLILSTMARVLLPLQLLFSVFMLLRGHDLPGGGFIAGLIAAAAFILYLFAYGVPAAQRLLRVDPRTIAGVGLVIGTLAAVPPIFFGLPFFTGLWWYPELPLIGPVSINTPLIFDIGVYLTVVGSVLTIAIFLAEAEE
ncbi:Na(+)/H(+) antiporter subunit B [Halorhodospira abdelmalekii]|uniref:Na+/H+ antiporter subunit B n=1 Tax=Halorhodospira abdelmalekii TaxID=421629 RepID=UPI001905E5EF|nr:Na(+)/H(+) antiporter subunit B [Halorhodospira abdelmalekii]